MTHNKLKKERILEILQKKYNKTPQEKQHPWKQGVQLGFDFFTEEKPIKIWKNDFITSKCNLKPWNFINNYCPKNGNLPKIFAVIGKKMSGKTHLAQIWKEKFSGQFLEISNLKRANLLEIVTEKQFYIIENVDSLNLEEERILLQIFNLCLQKSAHLLLTSAKSLEEISLSTKDLSSRLRNVFHVDIMPITPDFSEMLLVKIFAEKQLRVSAQTTKFLAKNIITRYQDLFAAAKLLEFNSLEKRRAITIGLVKEIQHLL